MSCIYIHTLLLPSFSSIFCICLLSSSSFSLNKATSYAKGYIDAQIKYLVTSFLSSSFSASSALTWTSSISEASLCIFSFLNSSVMSFSSFLSALHCDSYTDSFSSSLHCLSRSLLSASKRAFFASSSVSLCCNSMIFSSRPLLRF